MKKENVPEITKEWMIEALNEALDRKSKKIIVLWDKLDKILYARYLLDEEIKKEVIKVEIAQGLYICTIDVEAKIRSYAILNEDGINYDKAWFHVEFPDLEKITAEMQVGHRT